MGNLNNSMTEYQPEYPKNPYIGTIWFGILILIGIIGNVDVFLHINEIGVKKFISIFALTLPGIIGLSYLISLTFILSEYITLTNDTIIGRNSWKKKKGEIRFDEIEEIYVKGNNYFIHVVDIHGNKLIISALGEFIEEVMNTILRKAKKCKHIDIKYIQNRFPNISVYERGNPSKKGLSNFLGF